jgi:MFS transporter, DHA1 family, multidrug resistance protein
MIMIVSILSLLSLDMYMPALPSMTEYFKTSSAVVNITLVGYSLANAFGLLLFGTLSDKYGRKRLLLFGTLDFTLSSMLCAIAPSIWVLVGARILQALGASAGAAVAMAIIKDCFSEGARERVLMAVQIAFVLGPILAPIIGGQILLYFTWRATFWTISVIGVLCVGMAMLYRESLPQEKRYNGTIAGSIGRLAVVGKNKSFIVFLFVVSLLGAPFMAYIASSSYIYISFFGLSEQGYSFFFALAAALSVLGPFIYLVLSRFLSKRTITHIIFVVAFMSGTAIILVGETSPIVFFATFVPFYLSFMVIRPYSTNILMSQHDTDAGATSSLINFTYSILGCAWMFFGSFAIGSYVASVGIAILLGGTMALVLWILLLHSKIHVKGLEKREF